MILGITHINVAHKNRILRNIQEYVTRIIVLFIDCFK
jgi:hypothetical protein